MNDNWEYIEIPRSIATEFAVQIALMSLRNEHAPKNWSDEINVWLNAQTTTTSADGGPTS